MSSSKPTFHIRSGEKGIKLRLHELEADVMDVIWAKKFSKFAVRDVVLVLEKQRSIAYTTVMTTLARLYEKGLFTRERDGNRYLYTPMVSREEFLKSLAREVLDRTVGAHGALEMLVEKVSEASTQNLDELLALIQQRRLEIES